MKCVLFIVLALGFAIPCEAQFSGLSLDAGKDLIKNMTDKEVFFLLGDIIFRSQTFEYIFHKLEPVPFSLGPLLSPPSLKTELLNNLLQWVLDRLPSWLENPHFVNAFHKLVVNLNDIDTTGFPKDPNAFSLELFTRTDLIKVLNDILISERSNITTFLGLNEDVADVVLPWTLKQVEQLVKVDGPPLLDILVNELNAVNVTGLNESNPTEYISGIRTGFNYLRTLQRLMKLPVVHSLYSIIGLKPAVGDTIVPALLTNVKVILKTVVEQLNHINITEILNPYVNATDKDIVKAINYIDMLKSVLIPKYGNLLVDYLSNNSVDLLRLVAKEANNIPMFLVNMQYPHDPVQGILHYFSFENLFMNILKTKGDPLFEIVGLNPEVGKKLASVIAVDFPELVKITINELNRINQTTLQSTTGVLSLLSKIDYTSLLNTFATNKIATSSLVEVFGIKVSRASELLPWVLSHTEHLVRQYGPGLFHFIVDEINRVNFTGINTRSPDAYVDDLLHRVNLMDMLKRLISTPANESALPSLGSLFNNGRKFLQSRLAPSKQALAAPTCGADFSTFLSELLNGKKWALEMLDAFGKPPAGILTGSLHMIGSYDECIAVHDEDNTTSMTFGARYCRVSFALPDTLIKTLIGDIKLYGVKPVVTLGMCLPDTCGTNEISDFFASNILLQLLRFFNIDISPAGMYCDVPLDMSQDTDAIVTIVIVGVIVVIVAVATLIHGIKYRQQNTKGENTVDDTGIIEPTTETHLHENGGYDNSGDIPIKNGDLHVEVEMKHLKENGSAITNDKTVTENGKVVNISNGHIKSMETISDKNDEIENVEEEVSSSTKLKGQENRNYSLSVEQSIAFTKGSGLGKRLVFAFSAIRNLGDLTSMRHSSDSGNIKCIHGIRFITLSWIMLGNTYIYCVLPVTDSAIASDLLHAVDLLKRFTFQAVVGASLGTDTFFMISGCLMAYFLMCKFDKMREFKWTTLIASFFHKYWRLTPAYMIAMAVIVYLYRYLGSGPAWIGSTDVLEACRDDWWLHLLRVNNLVRIDGRDVLHQCFSWGWFVAVLMQFYLISPFFIACIMYSYRLGAAVISLLMLAGMVSAGVKEKEFGGDLLSSAEDNGAYWNNVFIAPWCRVSSYCVGLLLAILLFRWKDGKKKVHMALVAIFWLLAVVVGIFIVYITYTKFQDDLGEWTSTQLAAYEALARPMWSVCVAWVVFSCFTGYGGYVDSFLSWEGFLPLSRLSYAAYLVHPAWIVFSVFTRKTLIYLYSDFEMMYVFLGHLLMSYGAGLLLALVVERPFMNLERALLKKK